MLCRTRLLPLGDFPPWFLRGFGLAMGLLWGSFLNVVIYRVPLGMSVVRPASHCPACGAPVAPYDNVPVLAFLWLRGRARCCKAKLSWRYPAVEALVGLLALAVVEVVILKLPPETSMGRVGAIYCADLAFILGLVGAAFIDLDHVYIPAFIPLGGTVLGVATSSFRNLSFADTGLGAAVGFLGVWLPFDFLYRKLRGRTGMAMGDAMLVMMAGAWFGWRGAVFALAAGSIHGVVAAIVIFLVKGSLDDSEAVQKEREAVLAELEKMTPEERAEAEKELDPILDEPDTGLGARLPFGPFLAMAMLEYLFVGPELVRWTLGF